MLIKWIGPYLYLNKQSFDAMFMPLSELSDLAGYSVIAVCYKDPLNILV
jgi:hypothetical protein